MLGASIPASAAGAARVGKNPVKGEGCARDLGAHRALVLRLVQRAVVAEVAHRRVALLLLPPLLEHLLRAEVAIALAQRDGADVAVGRAAAPGHHLGARDDLHQAVHPPVCAAERKRTRPNGTIKLETRSFTRSSVRAAATTAAACHTEPRARCSSTSNVSVRDEPCVREERSAAARRRLSASAKARAVAGT